MVMERLEIVGSFKDLISDEMTGAISSTEALETAADDLASNASAASAGVIKAFSQMGGVAGAVTDEIKSRTDGAISTFVEFGATGAQVAKAFETIGTAAESGSEGMAQTANVLRKLVDETEDADQALDNVGKAFEIAAATGMKAEDAAAELGKTLKGDTSILAKFDDRAKDAAKAIEQIRDPALRAKAATRALSDAMKRQNSVMTKVRDRMKALKARSPRMVKAFKGLAVGAAGFGAALIGVGTKAVGAYLRGSERMRKRTKAASKAIKEWTFQLGGVITKALGIDKIFDKSGKGIAKFRKVFDDNRLALAKGIRVVASLAIKLGKAVAFVIGGLVQLGAFAIDAINAVIAKAKGPIGDMLWLTKEILDLVNDQLAKFGKAPIASKETMAALLKTSNRLIAESKKPVSFSMTEAAAEGVEAFNSLIDVMEETLGLNEELKAEDVAAKALGPRTDPAKLKAGRAAMKECRIAGRFQALDVTGFAKARATQIGASNVGSAMAAAIGAATGPSQESALSKASDEVQDLQSNLVSLDGTMLQLANSGIAALGDGLASITEAMATGSVSVGDFGAGLLGALGEFSVQAGQAFLLLGTGLKGLEVGDISGTSAIAIGVGLLALGGALRGVAARASADQGGDGGQTAAALERFGRRLFDRPTAEGGREIYLNVEGRSMRAYVLETAAEGMYRGQLRPMTRS